MSKESRQKSKDVKNQKLDKKDQIKNLENFGSVENQNERHNAMKEALGPNTKR